MAVSAVLLGALAASLGCNSKQGPAGPSGTEKPQTLTISGVTSLSQPGETSQLTATALFTDGKTRDVTAETTWTGGARASDGRPIVTVSRGLLTAASYGWANLWASYLNVHATVAVRVGPEGAFFVSGHVTESGFPVEQARVEATSPSATLTAVTGQDGSYVVPAQGDVILRVVKDGYEPEITRLTVSQDQELDLAIRRTVAPGDIRGIWQLAIVAAQSCSTLPAEALRREYAARVSQTGQDLTVEVQGTGWFEEYWKVWGFVGTQQGATVTFKLGSAGSSNYSMYEFMGGSKPMTFNYAGTASGTVDGSRMVVPFAGRVTVEEPEPGGFTWTSVSCDASDHRLEFVR